MDRTIKIEHADSLVSNQKSHLPYDEGSVMSHMGKKDDAAAPKHVVIGSLAIWAVGLRAASLAGRLNIRQGSGGRIDVQPDSTIAGFPCVYALGDVANRGDGSGKMLPQWASVAQQAGRHCAKNIAAHVNGLATSRFAYFTKGIMAMIGCNAAVAEIGSKRHAMTGFFAFIAWLGVHAALLATGPAKISVCCEWVWNDVSGMKVEAILDIPGLSTPGPARVTA